MTKFEKELLEVLRGVREELIRIGEILQDTALPRTTQIVVRKDNLNGNKSIRH